MASTLSRIFEKLSAPRAIYKVRQVLSRCGYPGDYGLSREPCKLCSQYPSQMPGCRTNISNYFLQLLARRISLGMWEFVIQRAMVHAGSQSNLLKFPNGVSFRQGRH